jgi:hypothetical protein
VNSPDFATYFFTQGVLGVVTLVLGGVVWKLYAKVQQLQDARLQDTKDVAKDVTTVLAANTQSNLLLAAKIEASKKEGS